MSDTGDEPAGAFINHYCCSRCQTRWSDRWSAQCNDRCPSCGLKDIEPYASEDA